MGKKHRVWEPGLAGGRAEHVKESRDGTVNVMVPVLHLVWRWIGGGLEA